MIAKMRLRFFGAILASLTLRCVCGGVGPESAPESANTSPELVLGTIRVNAAERTLVFPACVNLREGAVEYGIVTPLGALHESLLVTDVNPVELHAAVLLLGVKPPAAATPTGPVRLDADYLRAQPALTGQPVRLWLRWKSGEQAKRVPLEDWLVYSDGKPVAFGPWVYTGSFMQEGGRFAALGEGSVLCLVTNPAALLNNPRPGHGDDHVWEVRGASVPPVGTPVEVEIRIEKRPEAK